MSSTCPAAAVMSPCYPTSIHLRFRQLRLSFSQQIFSRSKFDPSIVEIVNNGRLTDNAGCL